MREGAALVIAIILAACGTTRYTAVPGVPWVREVFHANNCIIGESGCGRQTWVEIDRGKGFVRLEACNAVYPLDNDHALCERSDGWGLAVIDRSGRLTPYEGRRPRQAGGAGEGD